jgi:SCP-2 sterol transfer family protein
VRPTDLRALVTGKAGPTRLALRGRLRVIGDLGLGTKLGRLFSSSSD